MTSWRAVYSNTKTGEICEILESSSALTRDIFWTHINNMFYDACAGCENDALQSLVICGGTHIPCGNEYYSGRFNRV